MNLARKLFLLLGLLAACPTWAAAHAFLDHADPKVGAVVKASPTTVKVWLTKDIVKDGSNLQVFDAKGVEVDEKDARIAPDDHCLISVSIPQLPPGTYKVVWNAVCKDTHHTSGDFLFQVADHG